MKEEIYNNIANIDSYTDATKDYIKTLIEDLYNAGKLESSDIGALNLLASSYDMFIRCSSDMLKVKDETKQFLMYKFAMNSCFQIVKDFGLTPKARKILYKRENSDKQTNTLLDSFDE